MILLFLEISRCLYLTVYSSGRLPPPCCRLTLFTPSPPTNLPPFPNCRVCLFCWQVSRPTTAPTSASSARRGSCLRQGSTRANRVVRGAFPQVGAYIPRPAPKSHPHRSPTDGQFRPWEQHQHLRRKKTQVSHLFEFLPFSLRVRGRRKLVVNWRGPFLA